jgi:hypothetical protein
MRISPEPLHPMRSWRELWQSSPVAGENSDREHASSTGSVWKQEKRGKFNWFNQLFHRGSSR